MTDKLTDAVSAAAVNKIQLTQSQTDAFAAIVGFFQSQERCFILKGYAGTGKTFLIRLLAKYLRLKERQFFLIAPTGRAARILTQKTGFGSSTIHSLIYGEAKESVETTEDMQTVSLKFALRANNHEPDAVYIVDESSMLADTDGGNDYLNFGSGKLLADLFKHTRLLGEPKIKGKRRQVIFVGDPAQLPPVSQEESVALSPAYLMNVYGIDAEESILTEVVRQQENSAVLSVATTLREAIDTGRYYGSFFSKLISHEIKEQEVIKRWAAETKARGEENTIVIVSTNKFAAQYNNAVRRHKYGSGTSPVTEGDRLLVMSNNRLYGLLNGDIVEVTAVSSDTETHSIQLIGGAEARFDFRDVMVTSVDEDGVVVEKECKIIENILWSASTGLSGAERQALRLLANDIHGIKPPSKALKKKNPDEFKQAESSIKETLAESPYINALIVKFGYAITCHKAQGGEWQAVFMDFRSFAKLDSEEYYRWAYTGITRAREKLYSINVPKTEYTEPVFYYD